MIEIYAVNQNEVLDNENFKDLLSFVSDEKKARINRYLNPAAAQQSLISDVLVRSVIHEKLNLKNSDIHFGKNEYGKPFLLNQDNFHFNVSHSDDWVVCAISDSVVGIDVEKIKPTDFKISQKFFSKDENEYLTAKIGQQKLHSFYDLWTLKESYIKAIGKGLHMSLKDFSIIIYNGFIYLKQQLENQLYNFKQFSIDVRYKLSVCLGKKIQHEKLYVQNLDKFVINFKNNRNFHPAIHE